MPYWLFKSEPGCFSYADLEAAPGKTVDWDGVRNFQARNFLRDQVRVGDGVFFYHSNADPPAIAGIAEVVKDGHPDPTAFDPSAEHPDPESDPANPKWFQVSIRAVRTIDPPLGLSRLREVPELAGMELLRKGSRLSVQPVSPGEWDAVLRLAGIDAKASRPKTRSKSRELQVDPRRHAMPTIEHFAVYAADAPGLKDFYVDAFGMKVAVESGGDPPGFFLCDDRGTAVEIIGRPRGQSGANQRWVCHLAFWVDDFRAAHDGLARRGVRFEADTAVDNEAFKTAFFNDPEGNRLQIVWRARRLGE